jgi:anaerobic selenocysteine-containing dehydrogenase
MGMQRHGGGGMAARVITCIPGVTGDWRYPGGGAVYDTRGFFRANWRALLRDDLRPAGVRRLSMTRLGEGLLEVDDPPVQALLVYSSNPLATVPDQNKVRRGLTREDLFTVVIDHFQTDTADYADILLPATMQTEHADLHYAYGHLYVAWNEPAVPPPGECLPNSEIFRRLARALGVTEPCVYDSDEEMAGQVLASDAPALAGITLERLRRDGWARLAVPTPFVPFADGFLTASRKLEFYSSRMAEAGLDPVPTYTRRTRRPSATPTSPAATRWPSSRRPRTTSSTRRSSTCPSWPSARAGRRSSCIRPTRPRGGSARATRRASTTTGASSGRA